MQLRECLVIAVIFAMALPTFASAESSSAGYILWGSAAAGSGGRSTSANFINYGTAADVAATETKSASYRLATGFEAIYEEPKLTQSISTTSVSLNPNPLTTGTVSTASMDVTVSTNADFGYTLTIKETAPFQSTVGGQVADVVDGAVTAGANEYGVALTGADRAFADDRAVTSMPLTVASSQIWGADRTTTVTFKAAISGLNEAGSYSGAVTFIATGKF